MRYIIFNNNTNKIESDCGLCGIKSASKGEDFLHLMSKQMPDDHSIKILNGAHEVSAVKNTNDPQQSKGKEIKGKKLKNVWKDEERINQLNTTRG